MVKFDMGPRGLVTDISRIQNIEPKDRQFLVLTISKERNIFVAERFLSGSVMVTENIRF